MTVERIYLKERYPKLGENGCNAYLDCYIPQEMTEMQLSYSVRPCMLICPGGGYIMVSEREAEPVGLQFVSEGYCVFVLHYSTEPHAFPQQLLEVAAAMETIAEHAQEWVCDINNVAVMGFSAGGHLAAQYSNRYNCPEVREVFPDSKPVQKSILSYPVITDDMTLTHRETICNFVGHVPTMPNEKGCACEKMVTENTPPTFLWHTAEDAAVPVQNSLLYAKALAEKKVPFEMHIYPYGPHGLSTADEQTCVDLTEQTKICHQWLSDCKRWLKI